MKRLMTIAAMAGWLALSGSAQAQDEQLPTPKTTGTPAPVYGYPHGHMGHAADPGYYMPEGHHGWGYYRRPGYGMKGRGWLTYRPLSRNAAWPLPVNPSCTPNLNAYFDDQYAVPVIYGH